MSLKHLAALAAALFVLAPSGALAQSSALVEKPIVTGNCAAWSPTQANMIKDSKVGCANGNVTVSDSTVSTSALLTPNIYGLDAPGILNNTSQKQFFFTKSVPTTGQDSGDFECYRHANYTVTDHSHPELRGWVNPCFYTYTVAEAGGYQRFEWAHLVRLDNYSNVADDTENTALYTQARKFGTAPTFGFVTEVYDQTANPVSGSVADEHDMSAKGLDTNNARVIADFWARNPWDSTTTEVAYGLRLNTDANTTLKNGIKYNGKFVWGIDMSAGQFSSAAINLGDTHPICYDTACLRKKFFSSGVVYQSVPTLGNLFSWADNGQFTAKYLNNTNGIYFGGLTNLYPYIRQGLNAAVEIRDATNVGYGNLLAGNLLVPAGGKLCFDDYTCAYDIHLTGGNVLSTAANIDTLGRINTVGNHYFGALTSAYPMLKRNGTGLEVKLADDSGYANLTVNNLTVNGAFSPASVSTAGNIVSTAGNLAVASGNKICLNGISTCSIYLQYDGSFNVNLVASGVNIGSFNIFNQTVGSSAGFTVGASTGVSCPSGINASTFRSVKGIVTAC